MLSLQDTESRTSLPEDGESEGGTIHPFPTFPALPDRPGRAAAHQGETEEWEEQGKVSSYQDLGLSVPLPVH